MPTKTLYYTERPVTLPDLYSVSEVTEFVDFLKDNIDCYAFKMLLYSSEMILNHLKRIEHHKGVAEKLVKRANGNVSPSQHQFYEERKAKTAAKRFYHSMSDRNIDNELRLKGYPLTSMLMSREEKVTKLVELYVKNTMCEREEA